MSTSSIKRQIRRFHVVVVQWTSKKCTKKRDARAELLFWSFDHQSSYLLKLPIATDYSDQRNLTCQAKIMGQWNVYSSSYLHIIQKYES